MDGRSAAFFMGSFLGPAGCRGEGGGNPALACMKAETVYYKRSRFSSRLPAGYRYTPSHYWLHETEPGIWQVGFTKFATRMLGEMVEFDFTVPKGEIIQAGQTIGWMEGFK